MRILSAENYKMRKNRALKTLTVIAAAFAFFVGYAMQYASGAVSSGDVTGPNVTVTAEAVQQLSGYVGMRAMFQVAQLYQIIGILCAVFAGIFVVSEFDKGTIRNALSAGTSRTSWFFGKVYSLAIVTLWLTVVSGVVFTLTVAGFAGWGQSQFDNVAGSVIVMFLMTLLQSLAYSSIFLVIGFVMRSVAGTVGFGIAIIALESAVATLLSLLKISFINTITDNFLANINNKLCSWSGSLFTWDFGKLAIPAAIVIVVTMAISYFTFLKKDVK